MRRVLKQLAYGVFYVLLFGGIVLAIYYFFGREVVVSNVGCDTACEIRSLKITQGEVKILPLSESTSTIFVKISNLSATYGLRKFNYSLSLYSVLGPLITTINGSASLYPSESKYLFASGLEYKADEIKSVVLRVLDYGSKNWENADVLGSKPDIKISDVTSIDSQNSKIVEGQAQNDSVFPIGLTRVYVFGLNRAGVILTAATTDIHDLPINDPQRFRVYLPKMDYTSFETGADVLP